jgi:hypothetical protein
MATINPHWPRWIEAAIFTHFKLPLDASALGFAVIVEGQPLDDPSHTPRVEIRIDGPDCIQNSKNSWELFVEVNLLLTTTINDINIYGHLVALGEIAALFDNIEVIKCGNGPQDNGDVLGCLVLRQNKGSRDLIEINRFGQIEEINRNEQSTLEAHYIMQLTT